MKSNWREAIVDEISKLTGIPNLNGGDVYGAMILMTRNRSLKQVSKSLWSKAQYEELYHQLLDSDNFYNHTKEDFITAVRQTRIDRRSKKSTEPDQEEPTYSNPDEDMESVSKSLLAQNDIYYNESVLFNEWKSMNENLFNF